MPLYSEHIANMYYGGSTPYTTPSYSYTTSYLTPGAPYSKHSSLGGYSRAPLAPRWSPTSRNYSPLLSTISERGTGPSRITSPRRLLKRSYAVPTYTPRPIHINTADIDVSRDRYRPREPTPPPLPPPDEPVESDPGPFMPRVDGNPEAGAESSPGHQRSTIKRGRTVVRLHTIKRKDKDSPRGARLDYAEVQLDSAEQPETSQKWRDRLSEDLIYKDKREKKTLGAKLVEKFVVKDKDGDDDGYVKRDSPKKVESEVSIHKLPPPAPVLSATTSKSPDRRCSMELLEEQANLLDSLIRGENLSTAVLDLSKVGVHEPPKSNISTMGSIKRRKSSRDSNPLQTTKSDYALHDRMNSLRESRENHLSKKRSLKKSCSGSSICRSRLDSITEFPQTSVILPAIQEKRKSIKVEKDKPKPKHRPIITSTVEVSPPPPSPLKFKVGNVIVEETTRPLKKEMSYSSTIDEPSVITVTDLGCDKIITDDPDQRYNKTINKLIKAPNIDYGDAPSPEPDSGNFWDKIGKRETVYLKTRKQNLQAELEKNRQDMMWYPAEDGPELSEDKYDDIFAGTVLQETIEEQDEVESPKNSLKSNTPDKLKTSASSEIEEKSKIDGAEMIIKNDQYKAELISAEENISVDKADTDKSTLIRNEEILSIEKYSDEAGSHEDLDKSAKDTFAQIKDKYTDDLKNYKSLADNKNNERPKTSATKEINPAKNASSKLDIDKTTSKLPNSSTTSSVPRSDSKKDFSSSDQNKPKVQTSPKTFQEYNNDSKSAIASSDIDKVKPKVKISPKASPITKDKCKPVNASNDMDNVKPAVHKSPETSPVSKIEIKPVISSCDIDKPPVTEDDRKIDLTATSQEARKIDKINTELDVALCRSNTDVKNLSAQKIAKLPAISEITPLVAVPKKIQEEAKPIVLKTNNSGDKTVVDAVTKKQDSPKKKSPQDSPKKKSSQDSANNKSPQDSPKKKSPQDSPKKKSSQDSANNKSPQDSPKKKSPQDSPKKKSPAKSSPIKKVQMATKAEIIKIENQQTENAPVIIDATQHKASEDKPTKQTKTHPGPSIPVPVQPKPDIPEPKPETKVDVSLLTEGKKSEAKSTEPPKPNLLELLNVKPKKPLKDEPMLRPLIATPRPLQKKTPQIIHSSSSSESSSEEESSENDDADESDSSEESGEFFECENNPDGRTSTGSNDSGFDSSAPTSPAGFVHIKKDCDVNCHRKCEKLTANLCGVNQRLLVEALASRSASKRGGETPGSSSSSTQAASGNSITEILEKEHESSTAYGLFRKTGRFTPPAKTIPRFRKYNIEDFHFIKVLGKGSFGKVLLAELRDTEYYYAVKCLKKDVVLEDDDVECTLIERKVLALGTNHPYLCHLFATFQTDSHLFFVMEYLNGGDLMFHIQQSGRFPEPRATFYAAEIVSGLKFLHKRGIVYRDLKLDNILLDFEGHVRIADFGMCKLQIFLDKTADTFCGTPDYMAPEIIKGLKYNQAVDWWSFGVLLYEMLIGQSPFSGCDEDELFWSICNETPSYPRFLSQDALTVLTRLLDKDALTRLGGMECMHGDIRDQPFFHSVQWDRLERRDLDAPFKPRVRHPMDTQYFDRAFTGERPRLTLVEPQVLRSMDQGPFRGFSYTNPNATDR